MEEANDSTMVTDEGESFIQKLQRAMVKKAVCYRHFTINAERATDSAITDSALLQQFGRWRLGASLVLPTEIDKFNHGGTFTKPAAADAAGKLCEGRRVQPRRNVHNSDGRLGDEAGGRWRLTAPANLDEEVDAHRHVRSGE